MSDKVVGDEISRIITAQKQLEQDYDKVRRTRLGLP
jgi:hypothetical protein